LKEGHNMMIVFAEDGPDAVAIAAGHYDGDAEGAWALATATEVVVAADLGAVTVLGKTQEFVLTINITGPDTNAVFRHVCIGSYAAAFAAMVVLLNLHADIAGAAFGGDVLTIAETTDTLGDHTVQATFTYGGVEIPSYLSTLTHEGADSAALSVASNATPVLPRVLASARTQ
ncbi:MAG: hypothetical protein ACTSYX_02885, partial [Candidatus Thorarchaeota archaeon]